ncbi:uncharacterized protein LOC127780593 [Oryza glaberrima]|uniref:uncharacterized protein LOC127780593 n=1 Tax=Oryza glaberrima TaxID=4538 RepID=UPI00224BF417|nr:uncharacterized protein LOC127780593 [Oryza glaberrima]
MRFSADGDFLAVIVQECLMVFSCTYEYGGEARLSEVEYVKDDGIIRKKYGAVSLKDHCENVISLDWGSSNFLATGSSMGSMCIYTWKAYELPVQNEETPAPSMGQFDILYYRWSNINSIDISGPITCVGWSHAHPPVGENPVISIAGNDGFVIAWEIIDGEVIPEPTRNYVKEKNYFIPGYSDSPPGCVHDFDVESISSISVSGSSDDLGDDPSEQSDVEEPTYGNQKSDPTSAASDVKGDKDLTDEEMSEEEQEDDTPFEEKLMLKLNQLNEKAEECKAELSDVDTKLSNIFNKQDTLQYWLDHGMLAMQANFEGVQEGVTRYQRSKMIHTKRLNKLRRNC